MSLEAGNYVNDLVPTNPTGDDFPSQGDDHLRLIKTCLTNSLLNAGSAVMLTPVTSAGTGNEYTVATDHDFPQLGVTAYFIADKTNTGVATLNINGSGAYTIYKGANATKSGDIVVGERYRVVLTPSGYQMVLDSTVITSTNTQVYGSIVDHGSIGAAEEIDWSAHDLHKVKILETNTTITFVTPSGPAQNLTLMFFGAGSPGTQYVTMPSSIKWDGGTYDRHSDPDEVDIVRLTYDGAGTYFGSTLKGFV